MTSSEEYYKSNRNKNNEDDRFYSSTANKKHHYKNYNHNYNQHNFSTKHQYNDNSQWNDPQSNRYGNNRNTNASFRNNNRRSRGRGRGRRNRVNYNNQHNSYHNNNYNHSYHHPLDRSLHSKNRQTNSSRFQRPSYKPRVATTSIVTPSDIETKCAYAMMVINNAEYLSGAFTLSWSLMVAGCKADRVIIIDKEIDTKYGELISSSGLFTDKLVIPKKLKFTAIQKRWKRYEESGIYDWINTAFNKYYVFTLTQYSRVIMLDADQICLKNLDELFLLSSPAGICSLYSDTNDMLQDKHHGHKVSNGDIRRSYERQWGIKGCLFMIEPSQDIFKDMVQELEYLQIHNHGVGDRKCFLGADEKYLTKYFMSNTNNHGDSHWTHIHSKYSRLSYIDKTTLSDDPYLLHFCTFKPWKSPGNDKWIHEQWEDIAIWIYASNATAQYVAKQLPQEYTQVVTEIMSPDAQFYADVLKQKWSQKYMEFKASTTANNVLLELYHLMADSYKKQQAKKQNETRALKQKIKQNVGGNETYRKHKISFDYSKCLLLSALLLEQNEEKVMIPDKVIWQFWDKEEDEMPVNIKFCVDSVRKNNPDWKHILLTPKNIHKYLNENELKLPSNLLKFEKACHISDVVRVAILAKYGGIYCDATVICFKGCEYMNFNYIWDELLMEQSYDFVGFRYDVKRKWKYDERFCCWFMATKKDNGLFYSWLNKINLLMKGGKTCSSQLDVIDLLYGDGVKSNAFKKYVALGPGILDELFQEYCHYHRNFKYMLYDPRDFALLDELFHYEQLWYLNKKHEYDFKKWFEIKKPHFIKFFCAEKGSKELYGIIKRQCDYKEDKQVLLKDIMCCGLIIADVFGLV